MIVTALIENRGETELACEHGLALFIEYGDKKYLLDAGTTGVCFDNAEKLGLPVEEVEAAFLSHSHYDHSGGFEVFFERNKNAKLYLQRDAFENEYYTIREDVKRDIGMPKTVAENCREHFVPVDGDLKVAEGIHIVAHHLEGLEERAKIAQMYREKDEVIEIDNFKHEQSVVFELEQGLVIFNSCCHGGVEKVVQEVKDVFPGKDITAVFGGFHLMGSDGPETMSGTREDVLRLAEQLKELGDFKLYTGHCTGIPAFEILKEALGDRVTYLSTGCRVEL